MSKQVIDTVGTTDTLASGLAKANSNFTELYDGKLDLTGGTMTGALNIPVAAAGGALVLSPTWNSVGTAFNLIYGRVVNTASAASSAILDLGYGSTSVLKCTMAGNLSLNAPTSAGSRFDFYGFAGGGMAMGYGTAVGITGSGNAFTGLRLDNGGAPFYFAAGSTAKIAIDPTNACIKLGTALASMDVVLVRDAAAILALKDGTNAQKLRVYGTTTGTKYVQMEHNGTSAFFSSSSGSLIVGATTADVVGFFGSTGAARIAAGGTNAGYSAGSGTTVTDDSTFGGWKIGELVAALQSYGLIA